VVADRRPVLVGDLVMVVDRRREPTGLTQYSVEVAPGCTKFFYVIRPWAVDERLEVTMAYRLGGWQAIQDWLVGFRERLNVDRTDR